MDNVNNGLMTYKLNCTYYKHQTGTCRRTWRDVTSSAALS